MDGNWGWGLTNLDHEPPERERVLIEHYPTPVPDHLNYAAAYHAGCEGPGPPFKAKDKVDDERDGEEEDECYAGAEGGAVLVDAGFDGAE